MNICAMLCRGNFMTNLYVTEGAYCSYIEIDMRKFYCNNKHLAQCL
jgi:hypothetical protein